MDGILAQLSLFLALSTAVEHISLTPGGNARQHLLIWSSTMKEPFKSRKPVDYECTLLFHEGLLYVQYLECEMNVRQARITR